MATTPFGEHLRREREMRGVSLEEISTATRISVHFLEALESEKWEVLPGGIFNRGFIRAVAHFLGLDEESLIAEYALSTNDKPAVTVWAKPPTQSPRWLMPLLLGLLIMVLAAAGWLAYRKFGSRVKFWHRTPKVTAVQPPQAATPQSTSSQSAPPASEDNAPARVKLAMMQLKVEADKSTRLRIVADGKPVFVGKFVATQSQVFEARDRFEVTSTDASAVVLELNKQIQPPLGPPGQPGTVVLTRKGLKPDSGGKN
ncbi:MAG: helix-turn-helix domain-containing protein [Candidatus Acidiferrales bacterium]